MVKRAWDGRPRSSPSAGAMSVDVSEPPELGMIAAEHLTRLVHEATSARGGCAIALSGGSTPQDMFASLRVSELPWSKVHVFQADERVCPPDHPDRNLTSLRLQLLDRVPIPEANVHPMPVMLPDLDLAAERYEQELRRVCGGPCILDVVHLGLGEDGHTASLVPGDPVLEVVDRDVAATLPYKGRRRLTLTYPPLNRARRILWLVSGASKAAALRKLCAGDPSIPAGRIPRDRALVVTDSAACGMAC